jgi:type III restriction enzyme
MSLQFRIDDQVLKVSDLTEATEAVVHKYDAFLNLLCSDCYAFQRDAVRETLRFLVSEAYPDLERLARDNWSNRETIRQRYESGIDAYLDLMPLRDRKAVSLDLATGTGKSFVMYALAAIALAEGLADRVLVLCPSLTIEEGLLDKFTTLAGNSEFAEIMKELGAVVPIPCIRRGDETIRSGDICVENIHAVYETTGSSIRDSFRGCGTRTLVLNDEAHHLFNAPERALKEWMKFLQHPDFSFRMIVNVTGTPYVNDTYFPDVVYRYGLKQAIEKGVIKKPNYKLEDTYTAHDWQKTYAVHKKNVKDYGAFLKPLTIIVTQDIARCVEVWRELVNFLAIKENLTIEEAEARAIWVTSGVPSSGEAKKRVESVFWAKDEKDSPEKRRQANLAALKQVDDPACPVEWIVSVAMLSEGWDVKNVFQIVPHESKAFNSKLLIAQVLGRGLRVPTGLPSQPLVTINNHEKWSPEIGNLLKEVLEVENTLSWGYDPRRSKYVFPLYNLNYKRVQTTVETKREKARDPVIVFKPQDRKTLEYSTFSETGKLTVEIEHHGLLELEDAVRILRLYLRDKDVSLAAAWPKKRIRELIVSALNKGGYDSTFLSKENLLLLQQGFAPLFRELGKESPRFSQVSDDLYSIDLAKVSGQSFSESSLREHGEVWAAKDDPAPFAGPDALLWKQYQMFVRQYADYGEDAADQAKAIAKRIKAMPSDKFKSPWNVHYVSHGPERDFSDLLFENSGLFDSIVKMPNTGGYAFPYSFKPAKAAKTHTANEHFNPDFFLKVADCYDILVVEIKDDRDDSNRNRAKCRDGLRHFAMLNERLAVAGEAWRYHFHFLSPADYTAFFGAVREKNYDWRSGLMQELMS